MIRTVYTAPTMTPSSLIAAPPPPPLPSIKSGLLSTALRSVVNSPNNVHIRAKEIELYMSVSKNENLNKMPGIAVQRQPYERFISYGLCMSAVDSLGKGVKLKEEAKTLCDKFPRNPSSDESSDNAFHQRGMGFISQLEFVGAIKDNTVIALPLQIGWGIKHNEVDQLLIDHAEKAWDRHITPSTKP